MIRVEGLAKSFRDGDAQVRLFGGLDMHIRAGERLALLGLSGSGKSTLLRILGALDRDYVGKVTIDGVDLGSLSEKEAARFRNQRLGFVFQAFNLLGHLSALDNVCLPAVFAGKPSDVERGRGLLDKVGLAGKGHRRPAYLSGGEQQRVAIARALYLEPKILLCDEPTGNLDPKTGAQILDLFDTLHAQSSTTFVMVTHDDAIASRAENVLSLSEGAEGIVAMDGAGEPSS